MKLTRRQFVKANAAAASAAAAGITLPTATVSAQGKSGIRWDKGVCRFCGTGCGILVGTKEGRVVATKGDPDAPVNQFLNTHAGSFIAWEVGGILLMGLLAMIIDRRQTLRKLRAESHESGELDSSNSEPPTVSVSEEPA